METQQLFNDAHKNPELFSRVEEITENELFKIAENATNTGTNNNSNDSVVLDNSGSSGSNNNSVNNQGYSTTNQNPQGTPQDQPFNVGNFIDEKVAVELVDMTVPVLIGGMLKAFANKKVPKSQLQASQSEKELMYAPMKEVLRRVNVQVTNPFEALVYAALCVYGSKTAVVFMDDSYTIPPKTATPRNFNDLNELAQYYTDQPRRRGRPRKS